MPLKSAWPPPRRYRRGWRRCLNLRQAQLLQFVVAPSLGPRMGKFCIAAGRSHKLLQPLAPSHTLVRVVIGEATSFYPIAIHENKTFF
jgi:hypothetical protein